MFKLKDKKCKRQGGIAKLSCKENILIPQLGLFRMWRSLVSLKLMKPAGFGQRHTVHWFYQTHGSLDQFTEVTKLGDVVIKLLC